MFCGIIHITADRADILAGGLCCRDFSDGNGLGRIVEIDHAFGLKILNSQRSMGGKINSGMIVDELAHAVQRVAGCGEVLIDDGEFVCIQRLIGISHIAVDHVIQTVVFHDHDAVSQRMPFGLHKPDAIRNLLCSREVGVAFPAEGNGSQIRIPQQFLGFTFLYRGVDLRIREVPQLAGVIRVLVGDQDLADLFGFVSRVCQRVHIVFDLSSHVDQGLLIRNLLRHLSGHARVH